MDRFLEFVRGQFDIAVWSSSGSEYAQEIVRNVFPDFGDLKFVWSRERCTHRIDQETRETFWVKDLKKVKKLGYLLEQVLMVDDSPEKLERNYGNHIRVSPFEGSLEDDELTKLIQYLAKIAQMFAPLKRGIGGAPRQATYPAAAPDAAPGASGLSSH